MALSKIEELLFSAGGRTTQLLTYFRFADGHIDLRLKPVSDDQKTDRKMMGATFANAVIESIERTQTSGRRGH